jgi:hypothetical protein
MAAEDRHELLTSGFGHSPREYFSVAFIQLL